MAKLLFKPNAAPPVAADPVALEVEAAAAAVRAADRAEADARKAVADAAAEVGRLKALRAAAARALAAGGTPDQSPAQLREQQADAEDLGAIRQEQLAAAKAAAQAASARLAAARGEQAKQQRAKRIEALAQSFRGSREQAREHLSAGVDASLAADATLEELRRLDPKLAASLVGECELYHVQDLHLIGQHLAAATLILPEGR